MSKATPSKNNIIKPAFRKLRAYAFDPSLSVQLDNAVINNIVYKVPWEEVQPGPVGEYIEVIDYDPSCQQFYSPVDLDERYILAQDGLDPAESNPHFHQQMVYAVAMTTVKNFERALGRKINWSPYINNEGKVTDFVHRLRIYPHALREANAYYSPQKKALLFGYFSAVPDTPAASLPGGTVYTCLSHDIIAHETTHALLDGLHRRYVEATHKDSLAFHEAFADIVALFQHFTFPEVLKEQIARTRGDLSSQNLLGQLAQEFGKAIGHYGSLRDALGAVNEDTGVWEPLKPDPMAYQKEDEPHARGAILVATIFDAFINIYRKRVADLLRIASNGTGNLATGAIHPDLVNRMAKEASKAAEHILTMCIRALDYCPSVDINFGDYLRAIITADYDLVEEDVFDYRIAVIEAFQRRGIYPERIRNMSVESLLCKSDEDHDEFESTFTTLIDFFKLFKEKASYITNRYELYELTRTFITGGHIPDSNFPKGKRYITGLHKILIEDFAKQEKFSALTGLILHADNLEELGMAHSSLAYGKKYPKLEVHNLKLASRVSPGGNLLNQIVVTLTQRRGVVADTDDYGNVIIKGFFLPDAPLNGWYERTIEADGTETFTKRPYPADKEGLKGEGSESVFPKGWFIFRGGSTLIFDLNYAFTRDNVQLKYIIRKNIDDEVRMKRQYDMLYNNHDCSLNATYFGSAYGNLEAEPFAMIHKIL